MRLRTVSAALALLASAALAGCGSDPAPRGPFTGVLPDQATAHSVAFSPDGRLLATGSSTHGASVEKDLVQLWDAATGTPVGPALTGHTKVVYDLAFSPDGRILASGSWDGTVRLWNVADRAPSGEPIRASGLGGVWAVGFSPDGRTLATGGEDGTVRLWDVNGHQQTGAPFVGHRGAVTDVVFSPDGRTLGTAGKDGVVQLWRVDTRQPDGPPLVAGGAGRGSVAFAPDGRRVAVSGLKVEVIDVATRATVATWDRFDYDGRWLATVTHLGFSPDSATVLFSTDELLLDPATPPANATRGSGGGYQRYALRTLDVGTGKARPVPVLTRMEGFWSVAYSPDGKRVAWGTQEGAGVVGM
ncbi:hypothetical protein R8Z50_18535 [Longispora sp. K20-0274]|uniref:WD40 repeat domain-containing protein n=1 Tax=Longispora sp. K20-0274 TaxID=3088255 RepID=UPI00399A3C0F